MFKKAAVVGAPANSVLNGNISHLREKIEKNTKGHQIYEAGTNDLIALSTRRHRAKIGRGELHQSHIQDTHTLRLCWAHFFAWFDQMRFLSIRMAAAQRVLLLVSKDIGNCQDYTIAPSFLSFCPMNQSPTKFSLYIANRRQARERRRFLCTSYDVQRAAVASVST